MKPDNIAKLTGRKWNSVDDLVPEFDFAGTCKRIREISSTEREKIDAILASLPPNLARIANEHHDVRITSEESVKKAGSCIGKDVDCPVVCLYMRPEVDQATIAKLKELEAFLISVGYEAHRLNDCGDDPGRCFGLYSHILD